MITKKELIEKISKLEHNQWVEWSLAISERENISDETKNRWKMFWCDYEELEDKVKDWDRTYAKRIIRLLEKEGFTFN